jgi:nucleotide-binding universal stress UspA family protein
MSLRDLFCPLEATETPSKAGVDQAIALARGYGAALSVMVAGPRATAPYSVLSGPVVGDLLESETAKSKARAEKLAAEIKGDLAKSGAKGSVESCFDPFHDMLIRAKAHALCHDLTVLERPGGAVDRSEIMFEEMLFAAGRPVLLPVPNANPIERVSKVALAWDGSACAGRAVAAALALFEGLKEADVVVVKGEKDLGGTAPAAWAAAHFERHGAKAKVVELKMERDVATTIDTHANKAGADLVVMGAFGHSRLREFVLGGVTRNLSKVSSRPLLLAH